MRSEFTYNGYRIACKFGGYLGRPSDAEEESGIDDGTGSTLPAIFEMVSSSLELMLNSIDSFEAPKGHPGKIPAFFEDWLSAGCNGRINLDRYAPASRHDQYRTMVYDLIDRFGVSVRAELYASKSLVTNIEAIAAHGPSPDKVYELTEICIDGTNYVPLRLMPYGMQDSVQSWWEAAYWAMLEKVDACSVSATADSV